MMNIMVDSSMAVVNSWRIECEGGVADVHIDEYMRNFSGDVISRACFGSNYSEGEEIFLKLRALQEHMSNKILSNGIPGIRFHLFHTQELYVYITYIKRFLFIYLFLFLIISGCLCCNQSDIFQQRVIEKRGSWKEMFAL
jgi:hypothetical protein